MRILGVDPGTRVVGFACLESTVENPRSVRDLSIRDVGTLSCPQSLPMNERIGLLCRHMRDMLEQFNPDQFAMEQAFFGINAQSALKLGQIRGAFISAAYDQKSTIKEIAPTSVKKFIAGNGRASKEEIYRSLGVLMGFRMQGLSFDASDALAIAVSCALSS